MTRIIIGEVKYTDDIGYTVQGLRELLEYMAFIRKGEEYFSSRSNVYLSDKVMGYLFVDTTDYPVCDMKIIKVVNVERVRVRGWLDI